MGWAPRRLREVALSYDLGRLGAVGFQDLAAALAVATFGAGVQVMGAGRDGGRDLYYRGPLVWKREGDVSGEVWDGYTVLQVKHKAVLAARPADNAAWLWAQVRAELDEWADPESERGQVPDHLVVISNVPLSPVPGAGGHDRLNAAIGQYAADLADGSRDTSRASTAQRLKRLGRIRRITKWRFWDGNAIQTLLAVHASVRQAFPAFLTGPDVFSALAGFMDRLPVSELEPALRAHARTTLMGEGVMYFDEAGSGDGGGVPLHRVAVDLPVSGGTPGHSRTVLGEVFGRAEHVLRPSVTAQPEPRHLIVTGAPGNGKTTVSKFLVQVFRAAMLRGAGDLSADQRRTVDGVEAALARLGRPLPLHRRWPMRVDLAEYAQEGGLTDDSTLLKWIAHKVSMRSNAGGVTPRLLQSWMRQWPWLLVLDGLDEVTEPTMRKRLIERVTEFVNDAEAEDCDVLVILTTRPIGYTENIAPAHFERIDLDYLQPADAVRYGTLATAVRLREDQDRIERVVRQLKQAAADDSLRNLLRTPLQVLILTIIVDGAGHLAPDRYSLFWGYYETVFKREKSKQSGLHHILRENGQQIQLLHERVGFELQARSEAGDRSMATLSHAELRQITWQVLHDAGFKPDGKDSGLLDSLIRAATQRLVLIAPRGDDGYGFDVRSLQELMAAMHFTTGELPAVLERLRLAAPSPHWRNTWIFAAGRLFSTPQEHQHQAIVELVETVDNRADERLGDLVPAGPRLALELIDDGMARSLPRWRERLIAVGVRVLQEPELADAPIATRILVRFADTGNEQRNSVAEALREALGGLPAARATAGRIQEFISDVADELGTGAAVRGLTGVRRRSQAVSKPRITSSEAWTVFQEEIATCPTTPSGVVLLQRAAEAVTRMRESRTTDEDVAAILGTLEDEALAGALAAALGCLAETEPGLVQRLRDDVLPALHRRPIGEALRRV